jgi:putative ABC transport system permease protein
MVTAATAVAVVVAVVTFASSIDHLVQTPRLYGFPGTFVVQNLGGNPDADAEVAKAFVRDPQVKRWSTVLVSELQVNGRSIPAAAFEPGARPLPPVVRAGSEPRTKDEIALGSATMHSLGLKLGDTVRVGRGGSPLRVVGTAVMPAVGTYEGADKAGLGQGVLVTPDAIRSLGPTFDTSSGMVVIETAPSVTPKSINQAAVRLGVPADAGLSIQRVPAPSDITALRRLRSTPVVLAVLLVLLITSTVVHALLLAVRRRRRDVAVLQCMGLSPGQVLRAALWQASTIAVVAACIGIPLGIVAGRWTWVVLAGVLGVVQEPTVPALVIAGIGIAVLVLAVLAGLVPGRRSSRRLPAVALRTE